MGRVQAFSCRLAKGRGGTGYLRCMFFAFSVSAFIDNLSCQDTKIQQYFLSERRPTLCNAIPAIEELQTAWEKKARLPTYKAYHAALKMVSRSLENITIASTTKGPLLYHKVCYYYLYQNSHLIVMAVKLCTRISSSTTSALCGRAGTTRRCNVALGTRTQ